MIFERFVFEYARSNMYVIVSEGKALVIDPSVSDKALKYLNENDVREITVLLTHEHYDHTSGLVWLSEHFSCCVICHAETALSLSKGKNSRPIIIASNRMNKEADEDIKALIRTLPHNYRYDADITFDDKYSFSWQGHSVRLISCPGHSKGSCCIEIDDDRVATGDSLILNTPVITRFSGGSIDEYNELTLPYLNSLSDDIFVLPGHGDMFYMKEARKNE